MYTNLSITNQSTAGKKNKKKKIIESTNGKVVHLQIISAINQNIMNWKMAVEKIDVVIVIDQGIIESVK